MTGSFSDEQQTQTSGVKEYKGTEVVYSTLKWSCSFSHEVVEFTEDTQTSVDLQNVEN